MNSYSRGGPREESIQLQPEGPNGLREMRNDCWRDGYSSDTKARRRLKTTNWPTGGSSPRTLSGVVPTLLN